MLLNKTKMVFRRRMERRYGYLLIICAFLMWMGFIWHKEISVYLENNTTETLHEDAVDQIKDSVNNDLKGLSANGNVFRLDGKPITIVSGAFHYFRLPREYWKDRLMKMKACGLNVVETYVPWNLHEPQPSKYSFDGNLDLVQFIHLAQEIGLYVIMRPGPYICSEWEFGGLPAWLLNDPKMAVRTMYSPFIKAVSKYFNVLIPKLLPLQYRHGGPVIAFQLDNEYGSYYKDSSYIPFLKNLVRSYGVLELLFTSDNSEGTSKEIVPGVLKTVNFKEVGTHFDDLKKIQPNAPLMVMEFWTGWFDWWGEHHHTMSDQQFSETLNEILSSGASVNFYMFFGGTNFGFMNGAFIGDDGVYHADTTSYDYDALVSENGDLTPKYFKAKEIIAHYFPSTFSTSFKFMETVPRKSYKTLKPNKSFGLYDVLSLLPKVVSETALDMESLSINEGAGQSYGYTLYRTVLNSVKKKKFTLSGLSNIFDRGIILLNQVKKGFVQKKDKSENIILTSLSSEAKVNLDVFVENGGRVNWKFFDNQHKGLTGALYVDGHILTNWVIFPFEMRPAFIAQLHALHGQSPVVSMDLDSPTFFIFTLVLLEDPIDTYIDMSEWNKGVVFVNCQNLGRYWSIGPQQTLFLPAPWLKTGSNDIVVFEEFKAASTLKFTDKPKFSK